MLDTAGGFWYSTKAVDFLSLFFGTAKGRPKRGLNKSMMAGEAGRYSHSEFVCMEISEMDLAQRRDIFEYVRGTYNEKMEC